LANTKKVSDDFIIKLNPKTGSIIKSIIRIGSAEEMDAAAG